MSRARASGRSAALVLSAVAAALALRCDSAPSSVHDLPFIRMRAPSPGAPAAKVAAKMDSAGRLTVFGTAAADRIVLGLSAIEPRQLEVDDRANGRGADFSFPLAQVLQITVLGGDGADRIIIDDSRGGFLDGRSATIDGGGGDDQLLGSTGGREADEVTAVFDVAPALIQLSRTAAALAAESHAALTKDGLELVRAVVDRLVTPAQRDLRAAEALVRTAEHVIDDAPARVMDPALAIVDAADALRMQTAALHRTHADELQVAAATLSNRSAALGRRAAQLLDGEGARLQGPYTDAFDKRLDAIIAAADGPAPAPRSPRRPPAAPVAVPDVGQPEIDTAITAYERRIDAFFGTVAGDVEVPAASLDAQARRGVLAASAGLSTRGNQIIAAADQTADRADADLESAFEGFALDAADRVGGGGAALQASLEADVMQAGDAVGARLEALQTRLEDYGRRALVLQVDAERLAARVGGFLGAQVAAVPAIAAAPPTAAPLSGECKPKPIVFMIGGSGFDFMCGTPLSDSLSGGAGQDIICGLGSADRLQGDDDMDLIFGGKDGDLIHGNVGLDVLFGQDGNDCMYGDDGIDLMFGMQGDDYMEGNLDYDLLVGFDGADGMHGGEDIDLMIGLDGDDDMQGGGGTKVGDPQTFEAELSDFMLGGLGNDSMLGQEYIDFMFGGPGTDTMQGNGDMDLMLGNDADDWMEGQDGGGITIDEISLFFIGNVMFGNDLDDHMTGGIAMDFMWGNRGIDVMSGLPFIDFMFGGPDPDTMSGGLGADVMFGNGAPDHMDGGFGGDYMFGGEEMDVMRGDSGSDFMMGNDDADDMRGGMYSDFMFGNAGNDVMRGNLHADLMFGGPGQDDMNGGLNGDFMFGEGEADTMVGYPGKDFMMGGLGDDQMEGDFGLDIMAGSSGNDVMNGGMIRDLMLGGRGADVMHGNGGFDVMFGGDQSDQMWGDAGFDVMAGNRCNDDMYGGTGFDGMYGNRGDDRMWGEDDADFMSGDRGDDQMSGGSASDLMFGMLGADQMQGDSWPDAMYGGGNQDRMDGGDGPDVLEGNGSADVMHGGDGPDLMAGGKGDDAMHGDDGVDWVWGGRGDDWIDGATGVDFLVGGKGDDQLFGDASLDVVAGNAGDDELHGGDGGDIVLGGSGADRLYGELNGDFMRGGAGDDRMWGEHGSDWMSGARGQDRMCGGEHRDNMRGRHGSDLMAGGAGKDRVRGNTDGDVLWGEDDNDVMRGRAGLDKMDGGDGDDRMFGNRNSDEMVGGAGDDRMRGGWDDDSLWGDVGADTLRGNQGIDYCDASSDGTSSICDQPAGTQPTFPALGMAEIRGIKFEDKDGDGQRGNGEPAIAGITIFIDLDHDAYPDAGEPIAVTAADRPDTGVDETGTYVLSGLEAGTYDLREVVPPAFTTTTPPNGVTSVTLGRCDVRQIDFGDRSLCRPAADGLSCTRESCKGNPGGSTCTPRCLVFRGREESYVTAEVSECACRGPGACHAETATANSPTVVVVGPGLARCVGGPCGPDRECVPTITVLPNGQTQVCCDCSDVESCTPITSAGECGVDLAAPGGPACGGSCPPGHTCTTNDDDCDGDGLCCKCTSPTCEPTADRTACKEHVCADPSQTCIPTVLAVERTCTGGTVPGQACTTDAACPGGSCTARSTVETCTCMDPDACHVAFTATTGAYCTGECPADSDACTLQVSANQYSCGCGPLGCGAKDDLSACEASVCPGPDQACVPTELTVVTLCVAGPTPGSACATSADCGAGGTCTPTPQILDCECTTACHVEWTAAAGPRCAGSCTAGETCRLDNEDGVYSCGCETPGCEPNDDGTACETGPCASGQECTPLEVTIIQVCQGGPDDGLLCSTSTDCAGGGICANEREIEECGCLEPAACHLTPSPVAGMMVCQGGCPGAPCELENEAGTLSCACK